MAGPDGVERDSSSSTGRDNALRAARWGGIAAVVAAVVTGVFSLWAATVGDDDGPRRSDVVASDPTTSPKSPASSPAPPAAGGEDGGGIPVRKPVGIHPAGSAELCLTEGPTPHFKNVVAVQRRCDGDDLPDVSLEPAGGGTYQVVWNKAGEGRGCLGTVNEPGAEGMLQPLEECGNATRFDLERVAAGGPGYRFRAQGDDRCVDVGQGSPQGAEAVMRPCSDGKGQIFTLDPVRA